MAIFVMKDWSRDRENYYDDEEDEKKTVKRKNLEHWLTIVKPTPLPSRVHRLAIAACARWYANASGKSVTGEQVLTNGWISLPKLRALGIGQHVNNPELNFWSLVCQVLDSWAVKMCTELYFAFLET